MKSKTTLFRVAEVADQLWLNGVQVKSKELNAPLQRLILETKDDYVVLEDQRVDIEFGAFKALNLHGNAFNLQAMMVSPITTKDIQ